MRTLRQIAGGNDRRKYDVQNPPAKYWGTWTPQGQRRVVKRSDGSRSTDKTRGFHSRPAHKLELRNANRSINKRARQMLKQQLMRDEALIMVSDLLGEELIVQCAWCKRMRQPDGSFVPGTPPPSGVSHTICPECFAETKADLDQRRAASPPTAP